MARAGLCQCGCGRKTSIAHKNCTEKGWVKGQPKRFLPYHYRKGSPESRFLSKLVTDPRTGCIEFVGSKCAGYGEFWISPEEGKILAHRYAWLLAGNKITKRKPHILHNCPFGDNPACCNVDHLWAGTPADNSADMIRKDRQRKSQRGLPFGVRPVFWGEGSEPKAYGSWVGGKYLGVFETVEEAAAVSDAERIRVYGNAINQEG